MKNVAIVLVSCIITWFVAKNTNKTEIRVVAVETHQEDTVLNSISLTHKKLNSAIESGDKKTLSIIDRASNTITSLREEVSELKVEVSTLQGKVKSLINENEGLKNIIDMYDDGGKPFNLRSVSNDKGN